jgi:hypothetical protein
MAHRDLRDARMAYAALRELIVAKDGGWDDAASRVRAARLCGEGIAALDDAVCREQLRAVAAHARDLYSSDRHHRWARNSMSGANYLRLQILIALETFNTRLFFIAALREQAGTPHAAPGHAPAGSLATAEGSNPGLV